MAVQNPFFGKREPDTFQSRQPSSALGGTTTTASTPTAAPATRTAVSTASSATAEGSGSKLTVGPNIVGRAGRGLTPAHPSPPAGGREALPFFYGATLSSPGFRMGRGRPFSSMAT